jgi:hypothetical protein
MAERGRRPCLIIMVKEPRIGLVKSRLAREIGGAAAARFYRCVTGNLIRRLAFDPRWRTVLAVTPDRAAASTAWPAKIARAPQGSGDLGARMERMLRAQGPLPAVLIGSDIPGIMPEHIADAFSLLRRCEAVFGPSEDGGFWLVGVKVRPRLDGLFRNVRWSSRDALGDCLGNLDGRKAGFAAHLPDVDDAASFRRFAHQGCRVTRAPED